MQSENGESRTHCRVPGRAGCALSCLALDVALPHAVWPWGGDLQSSASAIKSGQCSKVRTARKGRPSQGCDYACRRHSASPTWFSNLANDSEEYGYAALLL